MIAKSVIDDQFQIWLSLRPGAGKYYTACWHKSATTCAGRVANMGAGSAAIEAHNSMIPATLPRY